MISPHPEKPSDDDLDQHHVAFIGAAEAGLEEMHQRHPDLPQNDSFYLESHVANKYVPASGVRSKPVTASPCDEIFLELAR